MSVVSLERRLIWFVSVGSFIFTSESVFSLVSTICILLWLVCVELVSETVGSGVSSFSFFFSISCPHPSPLPRGEGIGVVGTQKAVKLFLLRASFIFSLMVLVSAACAENHCGAL